MTSSARAEIRSLVPISAVSGVWAAAIAVTPGMVAKACLAAPALLLFLGWWVLQDRARWLRLFLAAVVLLPPLPIALGDSGPHPALLFAAFGLWAGALWLGEWRIPRGGLSAALPALTLVLAASLAAAALHSGIAAAAGSAARLGLFALTPFVYFYTAHGPSGELNGFLEVRRLYWGAVAAALFACADFYFQFPAPAGYGAQFVWLDSGVYRRAQGLFYEASTLGNFCVFFLVAIAVVLTQRRRDAAIPRTALLPGGMVLLAALMLSYSRGSLINLAVALAALAWLNRGRWSLGRLAAGSILGGAAGAWLVWRVLPRFAEMYWLRLSASAQYFFSSTEGVLSGRVASWRTLLDWMAAHPLQVALGIGYKTLPYTSYLGTPVVADNMYLSLLIETGILGLAALVWLNYEVLRASLNAARSGDSHRAFFGAWMFCFWMGESVQMLSGDLLTYWRVLPVYVFVLALAVRR